MKFVISNTTVDRSTVALFVFIVLSNLFLQSVCCAHEESHDNWHDGVNHHASEKKPSVEQPHPPPMDAADDHDINICSLSLVYFGLSGIQVTYFTDAEVPLPGTPQSYLDPHLPAWLRPPIFS